MLKIFFVAILFSSNLYSQSVKHLSSSGRRNFHDIQYSVSTDFLRLFTAIINDDKISPSLSAEIGFNAQYAFRVNGVVDKSAGSDKGKRIGVEAIKYYCSCDYTGLYGGIYFDVELDKITDTLLHTHSEMTYEVGLSGGYVLPIYERLIITPAAFAGYEFVNASNDPTMNESYQTMSEDGLNIRVQLGIGWKF